MGERIKLTGLWRRNSSKIMASGNLDERSMDALRAIAALIKKHGKVQVVLWDNSGSKRKDSDPDFAISVQEDNYQAPAAPAGRGNPDDDLPF